MKNAIELAHTVSLFIVGGLVAVLLLVLSVMAVEKFMIRKRRWKKKNRS